MKKNNYIDNVLISLKRKYKKDELVMALVKSLDYSEKINKELKQELGVLKNKLNHITKNKEESRIARIESHKDRLYRNCKEQNRKLKSEIKELRELRSELYAKLLTHES